MANPKTVTVELSEREVVIIQGAFACKQASVARSVNNAVEPELRAVYTRLAVELNDLSRKFGG